MCFIEIKAHARQTEWSMSDLQCHNCYELYFLIEAARRFFLKDAKKSLAQGLDEIAEECGFSSANYFSLIFKKEVGISPFNYRKAK